MQIGVVYPQNEFPCDPVLIREFAQTAEDLGYTHILAYDHVLGADPEGYAPWRGPYTYQDPFMEPFSLFSYIAAATKRLGLVTGIVILPQRETALVAKQAATLDVLSNGRLRLGIGIGWNRVEYEALNKDFNNRGKRIEEQVTVLRQLWREPVVTFRGKWHSIVSAGLNPLPIQKTIPIWFGGHADAVLKRVAHLGDGWLPNYRTAAEAKPSLDKIARYLDDADRNWSDIGLEPRLYFDEGDINRWLKEISAWREAGATHLTFTSLRSGFREPQEHLNAIKQFAEVAGLSA